MEYDSGQVKKKQINVKKKRLYVTFMTNAIGHKCYI